MSSNGGTRSERGAKEHNLRPFAAQKEKASDGLDFSHPVNELFDEEPIKPDKHREAPLVFGAAASFEHERETQRGGPRSNTKVGTSDHARRLTKADKRSRTEREKLALERQHRFNRFITMCIAAIVSIAVLLLFWFLLIVDHIEVAGNARFTCEEIITESDLKMGGHIWLQNLNDAKGRVEENPYIESADIIRVYPNKILINVTERTEAAVIVGLNTQAVIDPQGYVLSIGARADYTGLIKISGMGFGGYHVGQRLKEESDFNSRTLVALLKAIYDAGVEEEIDIVDMSNPLSVYMTTLGGLTLHIGQPDDLDNKLLNYVIVLPKLVEMGLYTTGTLDLSAMGDPVYSPGESGGDEISVEVSPTPGFGQILPSPSVSPSPSSDPGDEDNPFSG